MIKLYHLAIIFLFFQTLLFGQGKAVLIGGGSEIKDGWSDIPYRWAIENSTNKKVAVISYEDQDNFIPDYFISLGAMSANNIKIESYAMAELQSTYDSLMQYDVFFFKGGDQSVYYTQYKESKVIQAVIDKFNSGGVISGTSAGMAILSEVMFTAENGSVYPDDCLRDYKQSAITLANDFLPLFPGFIFDTHFTERGRAVRLMSFMANWADATDEFLTGIGVDDRTALCIDQTKTGLVFGTGTVSFFSASSFQNYNDKKLLADSVHCTQLFHGHSIDLKTMKIISGSGHLILPPKNEETGNYQIMLSGSDGASQNGIFMNDFIHMLGKLTDTVALVTAPAKAANFKEMLGDASVPFIVVETSQTNNDEDKMVLRNAIRDSKKILFAENDDATLFNFLKGKTGKLIAEHCRRNTMVIGFIGEDSRYAGETFVTNHLGDQYAAYYGMLKYEKGLGLLSTTVVMADTYNLNTSDFYENTTAAVPFGMFTDSLRFGVYLNRNSYMRFYQDGDSNYFTFTGDLSGVVMVNSGTTMEAASQPVDAAGDKRDYVGFSDLRYVFLNGDSKLVAGKTLSLVDSPEIRETTVGINTEIEAKKIKVFPNPSANGIFNISLRDQINNYSITINDIPGRLILSKPIFHDGEVLDLSSFSDGMYLLKIHGDDENEIIKIVKQ